MIQYQIVAICEDEFDRDAFINAVKYKLKLDKIYNDVFRPIIKYSENKKEVQAYTMVWEKLSEYLEE